jgi:hypothetical protein
MVAENERVGEEVKEADKVEEVEDRSCGWETWNKKRL